MPPTHPTHRTLYVNARAKIGHLIPTHRATIANFASFVTQRDALDAVPNATRLPVYTILHAPIPETFFSAPENQQRSAPQISISQHAPRSATIAKMSLTNCRFYEEKYPEIDSFVMVNVKQVGALGSP
jgi:hypothetical protein